MNNTLHQDDMKLIHSHFAKRKTLVINPQTKEQAKAVMHIAHFYGFKRGAKEILDASLTYDEYGANTGYSFKGRKVSFSRMYFYNTDREYDSILKLKTRPIDE